MPARPNMLPPRSCAKARGSSTWSWSRERRRAAPRPAFTFPSDGFALTLALADDLAWAPDRNEVDRVSARLVQAGGIMPQLIVVALLGAGFYAGYRLLMRTKQIVTAMRH